MSWLRAPPVSATCNPWGCLGLVGCYAGLHLNELGGLQPLMIDILHDPTYTIPPLLLGFRYLRSCRISIINSRSGFRGCRCINAFQLALEWFGSPLAPADCPEFSDPLLMQSCSMRITSRTGGVRGFLLWFQASFFPSCRLHGS